MQRAMMALALLTSFASLVVIAGGGGSLLAIQNSGERATGAVLALGEVIAFLAVLLLVFAKQAKFGTGGGRAIAIAAAIIGALPVAALAYVLIRFAGIPFNSPAPLLDWTSLALGVLFVCGTLAILALGHRRLQESAASEAPDAEAPVVVHMQQLRHAQQQLRAVFEADARRRTEADDEEEVRVRRV